MKGLKRRSNKKQTSKKGSKKGGFIFTRKEKHPKCINNEEIEWPNANTVHPDEVIPLHNEIQHEYQRCCPKSILGFSNSHSYCKNMKVLMKELNELADPCKGDINDFKVSELAAQYKTCCPKGFFGRKNSSEYCKKIDAAISEKRQQAKNSMDLAAIYHDGKQDIFAYKLAEELVRRGYDHKTVFDAFAKGELNDMDLDQAIAYFNKMKTWQQRIKDTFFGQPPTNTRGQYETLPLEHFRFDTNGKVNYLPEIPSNFNNPLHKGKGGRRTRRRERKTKARGGQTSRK